MPLLLLPGRLPDLALEQRPQRPRAPAPLLLLPADERVGTVGQRQVRDHLITTTAPSIATQAGEAHSQPSVGQRSLSQPIEEEDMDMDRAPRTSLTMSVFCASVLVVGSRRCAENMSVSRTVKLDSSTSSCGTSEHRSLTTTHTQHQTQTATQELQN